MINLSPQLLDQLPFPLPIDAQIHVGLHWSNDEAVGYLTVETLHHGVPLHPMVAQQAPTAQIKQLARKEERRPGYFRRRVEEAIERYADQHLGAAAEEIVNCEDPELHAHLLAAAWRQARRDPAASA